MRGRIAGLVVLCVGAALVAAGIALGQERDVFGKAIRICLECIGIG